MIDIQIKINDTFLEGLTNTDIKLSVNSSSPYQFGESTRTYSGTIKAPRNKVNDGVFAQMRNFGVMRRKTKYSAKLLIGGVPVNKQFKAKVSCSETGYDIALSQSDLKRSQLPKEIIERSLLASGVSNTLFYPAEEIIYRAMGFNIKANFPDLENGYSPGILIENKGQKGITDELVGKPVTVFWRYASESDDGTRYFKGNFLDIKEYETRSAITAPGGVTTSTVAVVTIDNDGYVILDMSKVGTILNYVVLKAVYNNQTVAIFYKDSDQTDITQVRYKYISTTMNIPIYLFHGLYISRDINVYDKLDAVPPSFMAPDEAVNLSGKITSISGSAGLTTSYGDVGVSNAVDFLNDVCKLFQWGWRYSISSDVDGIVTYQVSMYDLISRFVFDTGTGPIEIAGSSYRQDWSDFFVSLDKIEDADEFPGIGVIRAGEYVKSIQLSRAAFTTKGEIIEAGVPLKNDGTYPKFIIRKTSGTTAVPWVDYLKSQAYTDRLITYFSRFSDAIDVTIKAKIPYFFIQEEYKEDGVVWFDQLNSFFYVRSITDYSLTTQECKVKLTKINLKR